LRFGAAMRVTWRRSRHVARQPGAIGRVLASPARRWRTVPVAEGLGEVTVAREAEVGGERGEIVDAVGPRQGGARGLAAQAQQPAVDRPAGVPAEDVRQVEGGAAHRAREVVEREWLLEVAGEDRLHAVDEALRRAV